MSSVRRGRALAGVLAALAPWSSSVESSAASTRPPAAATELRPTARALLEAFAPVVVQHVGEDADGRDWPLAIDFDGDWDTTNNAAHRPSDPAADAARAVVYGAAILTDSHAYLTYTLYYPRDWIDPLCLPYLCHDNDLENVLVVVTRAGELVVIDSKVHLGHHAIPGPEVARAADRRPIVWAEAGGHGVRACRVGDPRCAAGPGRLRYAPGPTAGRPTPRAPDAQVPYALVDLESTLWDRRHAVAGTRLWIAGETGPVYYDHAGLGRVGRPLAAALAASPALGSVRPPWAVKAGAGARGDWFLDPARTLPRLHPAAFAPAPERGRYAFHPFLDALRAECERERCLDSPLPNESSRRARWTGRGAIAALLLLGMVRQRGLVRRRARARAASRPGEPRTPPRSTC